MTPLLRPIRVSDLAAYKALRLEALQNHPEAFGSDYAEQAADPDAVWAGRIHASLLGESAHLLLAEAGDELAGMLALFRDGGIKTRHAASLVSVYLRPAWRGQRLLDRMIHQALAWCATVQIRIVRLAVITTNAPAIRCYHRCGFEICGIQREVIHASNAYHDELLMWRRV